GKVFTQFEISSILTTSPFELGLGVFNMLYLIAGMIVLIIYDVINERTGDAASYIAAKKTPVRWAIYYLFVVMILGSASIGAQQFIYFKF
ncbi:MAG: hypothetical protein IJ075_05480, partial [Lachnospiraceae bacterium]|nr:hypothetical protein [Lachnospiraceae bacterium]